MSPRSLGPYELREEGSQGRSGTVHLAWDSCDEREVSVHLLEFGELGARLRRRFEVEAAALMQLDHPNLVHVLDHGIDEDGSPYLVRETIHGLTLADLLELEGCLAPRHAAELAAKTARGLQAAHDLDLLHRDLNPASVIIDEAGQPRLTDFGLVRELSGDASAIRLKGRFLGTAGYLAPEQARAELETISVRTDVHGLGAILFALLTGQPPSSARTLIEAVDTLHEPAQAPSTRRPDLPRELDGIVLRCLAKSPPERFSSAAAVAEALEAWLHGPPSGG
jgi:serine/threonine protein kinase